MKKILGISGIRSDYDLMSSLYRLLSQREDVSFSLLVGGAHLSKTYGHTIDLIRKDGIPILLAVESLIDGDTPSARLKTAAVMLQNVIDSVSTWRPDIIIYAGDREEVWIGAMLGTYLEIPTIHFYGGDYTATGHVDNPIRHAVSKLSTAHFVAIEEHKRRLMAMGEDEQRIYVTGNLSIDNFVAHKETPRSELESTLGVRSLSVDYALVLFHPDPSEKTVAAEYMDNILRSLIRRGIFACVGYPNTDPENHGIIRVIDGVKDTPGAFVYRNLNRDCFISLYKGARFIIGNSSSGIMESASVPVPAINVGIRQRGRLAPKNVVFCDGDECSIVAAIDKVNSEEFREDLKSVANPYGDGNAAGRALEILLGRDFGASRLKTEDPLR